MRLIQMEMLGGQRGVFVNPMHVVAIRPVGEAWNTPCTIQLVTGETIQVDADSYTMKNAVNEAMR